MIQPKVDSAGSRLEAVVERHLPELVMSDESLKTALPGMARSSAESARVAAAVQEVTSDHRIFRGDARDLAALAERSIHLVVTSPPYWTLKEYNEGEHQLGAVAAYERFVAELGRVWSECHRVLVPGGRLVIIVGDVCLSRRQHGPPRRGSAAREHPGVMPETRVRQPRADHLAQDRECQLRNGLGGRLPGQALRAQRRHQERHRVHPDAEEAGRLSQPSPAARALSVISADDHREWFRQIRTIPGASTRDHPAPFPLELATRLVRMFSFVGDTVLDPFLGTGTTSVAAARTGRSSVGVEVDAEYLQMARRRFLDETGGLFGRGRLEVASGS